MIERLDQIEIRYEELTQALLSPEITNDSAKYQKTAKAHAEIAPIVEKYREFKDLTKGIAESRAVLADEKDADMRAYAEEELTKLDARIVTVEEELKVLLLPKDPNDEKNVVLEIRAGTGGDEATLFVAEVFRMYNRYAETQKWKVEVLSTSESGVGGLKEVIALIEGDRAACESDLPEIALVGAEPPIGPDVVEQLADMALSIATGERYGRERNTAIDAPQPGAP